MVCAASLAGCAWWNRTPGGTRPLERRTSTVSLAMPARHMWCRLLRSGLRRDSALHADTVLAEHGLTPQARIVGLSPVAASTDEIGIQYHARQFACAYLGAQQVLGLLGLMDAQTSHSPM